MVGEPQRFVDPGPAPLIEVGDAPHVAQVGIRALGRPALGPLDLGAPHLRLDRADNLLRHPILEIEQVFDLALEAIRPDMRHRRGIDELRGDANARAHPANAAFEHIAHAELAADLLHVDRAALVGEGRVARDDEQMPVAGQPGDDVLDHPVGEELLLGIRAHVLEGQDRDRGPVGKGESRPGRRLCLRLHVAEADPIDPEGPRDVLELLLALIDEADIDPAFAILLDPRRHADTAGIRQSFETRGHVDAVAENVAILDDDVADIDADPELDPAVRRHIRVALGHAALDVDGAADGIDDGCEFGQQPVPRRLHQASAILGDPGIEQGRPVVPQSADRAFLVGAHQPAVAGHIGGQDGREPSFQTTVCQGCLRGPTAHQVPASTQVCSTLHAALPIR